MKIRQVFKKIATVLMFESIVYFLAYAVEPLFMDTFNIRGGWLTGGWLFSGIVGAWINLLIIPILTFLVMWFFVKEPWYWFLWIPIYFLLKLIYYPTDTYMSLFFEGFSFDSVAVTVFVVQYLTWLIVMVATGIRNRKRKKKQENIG